MKVEFYQRRRGDFPVLEFIKGLPPKHGKKITGDMGRLEKYGLQQLLKTQDAKKIKPHSGLYELITSYERMKYRIFFSTAKNSYLMIHAFVKKSKKTPYKDLNKAISIHKSLIS